MPIWRNQCVNTHLEKKMLHSVFLLCCLLLSFTSSAPRPAVFPVARVSLRAPPTGPETPPSVIVEVENTKTNVTVSFTIFILADEETEGSGTDGQGRSDDNSSSSESNDGISSDIQPMKKENDEDNQSSEEVMSNQAMFTFSNEDVDDFNNTTSNGNQNVILSDDFDKFVNTSSDSNVSQMFSDDLNNSTDSREVHYQPTVTAADYFDDKNNTRFDDDTNNSNSKETANPLSDDSDHFNRTQSTEISDEPARTIFDSESQEEMSSSSEKTSLEKQDWTGSSKSSFHKNLGFGSRLQEVFHSIQKVVDLLAVNQGVAKGSPNSLTGFGLSSAESSESFSFGEVSSDPKNQTSFGLDSDSDESLEATSYSIQQGTGSGDSTQQVTGPTTSLISDFRGPDPDSKEVQNSKLILVKNGASFYPVSPDQDVVPTIMSLLRDTVSQESSKSFSRVNDSLNSDSSEDSKEYVGTQDVLGLTTYRLGLSRVGSPGVSSSSEEVKLVLSSSSSPVLDSSPVPSLQVPTESGSFSSEESDSSDSGSASHLPGLDSSNKSQSIELHLNPALISDSSLSPLLSREANPTKDDRTNTASMDTKPDAEADLNLEATTDARNDFSIEADPNTATMYSISLPSMHVISGASTDAKTDAGSELSVEEDDDASTESTAESAVSMRPTITEYRTNPPDSGASIDAIAVVESEQTGATVSTEANPDANSPGRNHGTNSKEVSPFPAPRRKRPYRFGFLGPISHSHSNQPVARETVSTVKVASSNTRARETLAVRHRQSVHLNPLRDLFNSWYDLGDSRQSGRKQSWVSEAAVANPAQSSSEETT